MKYYNKLKIRWLTCCLIFFIYSCRQPAGYKDMQPTHQDTLDKKAFIQRSYTLIHQLEKEIRSGDMITRTGNDFTSQSLKILNQRNQVYSHCGIASIENDTVFIYHALGGDFNPDQKIKRENFELFAEPYDNNGFGIFRFSSTSLLPDDLVTAAETYYRQGIMFDMDFDLKTDDRMYCAEFVYKSFLKAYPGKINFPLSHINKFEFIGVDDLFLHPLCRPVKEIVYK